jgi:exoribonuclease R
MGTGSDPEVDVGLSNAHLMKEHLGESFIIVLTSMHEQRFDFRVPAHLAKQRCHFDKIGSRTNNVEDLHFSSLT